MQAPPVAAVPRDIKIEQLSMVFYGRGEPVIALDKIDMNVAAGQFAAIIGPSGCGKSTLLRLVADIMQPFAGSISLGGESPRLARHAHSLGFVFQSPTLLPWRSVKQNIELPLDVVGRGSSKRSTRTTKDLIDLVGLNGFEDALPHQLSGGMQQRVAIARALVHEPRLLICDEPTASLDAATGHKVLELLQASACREDRCVIVVTHDSRIFSFADRIAEMEDGVVKGIHNSGEYKAQYV